MDIGAELLHDLSAELLFAGWKSGEVANWRDSGWSIECRRGASELLIVISGIQDGECILQISPARLPGLVRRLMSAKPSASASDVHELAIAVHHALSKLGVLKAPRWRWDGFPEDGNSTPEPRPV